MLTWGVHILQGGFWLGFFGFVFGLVSVSFLVFASALSRRYSFLRWPILVLTFLSDLILSLVGGLSSGNGIVDLLYSSLSLRFMCVNL